MSRITAEQRREIARERALHLKMNNKLENYRIEEVPQQRQEPQANIWQKGGETVADFLGSIAKGLGKGIEGIVDAGAGIVGGIGGLFDKDFQEDTRAFIEKDYTQDLYGKHIDEGTQNSYLNDNKVGEIIEGIGSGVGQMLPAVLVTLVTGGAGAPAAVAQGASLATMGVSAAGSSTEEAFKDGADYYKGLGYGAVSGAVEAATEKLTGGLSSNIFGKGLLDGASKSIAKEVGEQGVKRVLKGAAEEGFEEMVSEAVQPVTKAIYKGKDAFTNYDFGEHLKDIAEAGIIGAGTSLAYGGTVSPVLSKLGNGAVGAEADIVSSLESNAELENKLAKLEYDNKLTEADEAVALKNTRTNFENISKKLQKMGEEKRAKVIQKYSLSKYFNADGSISENLSQSLEDRRLSVETNAEQNSPLASLSRASYSTHLRGQEGRIQETLTKASEQIGTSVSIYQGVFEGQSNKNFSSFKKALNAFSNKSGERLSFVVVNPNERVNAFIDDNVVYIGADKISNNQWMTDVVHEGMHFNESSTEYKTLIDYLSKSGVRVAQANAQLLNRGYNTSDVNVYGSEMNAILAENMLGNEHFINKIVYEELSLGEKILAKIQNFKYMLETIKQQGSRAYRELVRAEKLYLKAIENYRKGVTHTWNREESNENVTPQNQGVESDGEIRYSFAGENSKTADLTALQKAKALLEDGASSEEIRKTTGWFKGYDGLWRYEISDKDALLLDNDKFETHYTDDGSYFTAKLSDVLEHRKLFEAYPQLKDITLIIQQTEFGTDGVSFPKDNQIVLNRTLFQRITKEYTNFLAGKQNRVKEIENTPEYKEYNAFFETDYEDMGITADEWLEREKAAEKKFFNSELGKEYYNLVWGKTHTNIVKEELGWSESARAVLLHEIQHHIQYVEDFAAGSSDTFWYKKLLQKYKSDYASAREEFLKLRRTAKGDFRDAIDALDDAINKFDSSEIKIAKAYDKASSFTEREDELEVLWNFAEAGRKLNQFYNDGQIKSSRMYELTAGEIESRDVAGRADMSEVERKETRPDIDRTKVYFTERDTSYSLKDSHGRTLTEQQAKFFADSKVRDEQGNLLVVYHGSKNAGFTEFKTDLEGSYFTADRNYAEEYARGKDENVYSVYLNITKPFDTRNRRERRIFEEEFYGQWGNGAPLTERGLLDWTDGGDMYDFIQEKGYDYDGIIIDEGSVPNGRGGLRDRGISYVAFNSNQIKLTTNENPTSNSDIRYSLKKNNYSNKRKIVAGMTDVERYEILKDKIIENIPVVSHDAPPFISSWNDINTLIGVEKKNLIRKIASEFGVFGKNYLNSDIELEFEFSKRNYSESYQKQKNRFVAFAKMFSVFDSVVSNAVGIEVHNKKDYKFDNTLKNVYVLISLFEDSGNIVPVKLEVKEFEDKTNKLYVAVALNEIKKAEVLVNRVDPVGEVAHSTLSANISISDLLKKINPEDKDFYKYIPKQFNEAPKKFSLKANTGLSEGEFRKIIANLKFEKKYSLNDAKDIVRHLVKKISHDSYFAEFKTKDLDELSHILWKGLNTEQEGYRGVVERVADYLIEHASMQNIYTDTLDTLKNDAQMTLDALKRYLHSLDLRSLKGEITHSGRKELYLRWSAGKTNGGLKIDKLPDLLAEDGIYFDEINPADILFRLDDLYNEANQNASLSEPTYTLEELLGEEELKTLKQSLMRETLFGFDFFGEETDFAKLKKKHESTITKLKEELKEALFASKVKGRISYIAQKITEKKLETFHNATQASDDTFKKSIGILARLDYRGAFNESARNAIQSLSKWYVKENPLLTNAQEPEASIFDQTIADAIVFVASGNGKLTLDELKALEVIVRYFNGFLDTYNKTILNGRWVDVYESAEQYYQVAERNGALRTGKPNKLTSIGRKYSESFSDPAHNARAADMYDENGFNTAMFNEFRQGEKKAAIEEMHILAELEEFYKKNKKWTKEAATRKVTYLNQELPLLEALSLYMSLNREQAVAGLLENGFVYKVDEKGHEQRYEVNGVTEVSEDKTAQAQELRESIKKQLNTQDVQFLDIAWKIFNEKCKKLKHETDMRLYFYSNIVEGDYFPIKRDGIAYSVEQNFMEEMSLSSLSFNKDTIKGAKGRLFIEPITEVINRHVKGVCQYAHLKTAIDSYNKIYSMDIGGNKNKPKNLRSILPNQRNGMDEYFKKLITDIKGIKIVGETAFNKALSSIRGGFVKFQLGLNLKVLVTQLSSFGASVSIINPVNIIKGFNVRTADLDKYCPLAELRNNENTIVRAQGVIDKIGDFGSLLMKPIGMVDRFVVQRLYAACQYEIASKKNGAKVGTEDNKIEAGKLLETVIFETQQNSMATERSQAMRSHSEIMKALTMFSSDAMKVIGRVLDGFGEISALKARIRIAEGSEKTSFEAKLKVAQKKTIRSIAALVSTSVFMACVAQAFKSLYKKDEDEKVLESMAFDAVGNLLGGLPIIKDIYAYLMEGYDINNYAYNSLNSLLESAGDIIDTAYNVVEGKATTQQIASGTRSMVYAVGQLLGLPVRNLYNTIYGLINRFDSATAYKIDNVFYSKSYSSDLNKALEEGNERLVATISGIMLNENIGDITDEASRKELNRLVLGGYNVIPSAIKDSVSINGEETALTNKQKKEFNNIYSIAHEALASLVKQPLYDNASDETKAKAIKFIYDTYYDVALQDALGVDADNKNVLFAEAIDIEKLALIIATARSLTADKDKKGNSISGSKKAKVQQYVNSLKLSAAQKYMIMGYLGYSNNNGELKVKTYINRLALSKSEKEALYKYSGYVA